MKKIKFTNLFDLVPQKKKVISKNATVGVYYWKHGSDYVQSAESMIKKNINSKGFEY